jgi:uncharacterized glyoxalase superfamily protein PhnB
MQLAPMGLTCHRQQAQETAMSALAMNTRATLIPCLAYRDANAAIQWLCDNFGFVRKAVYPGEDGRIVHAELTFGNGMIMLGSSDPDSEYGRLIRQPDDIGGRETQTVCVIASDPDEIYRRARAAGAKILREIRDESYGGRGFICSDPQGHIWSVGSYDPWKSE